MKQWDAFDNLRSVQDELAAARFSVGRILRIAQKDTTILRESDEPFAPSQLRLCAANLELTYVLRLFAEFEGITRDYWDAVRPARRRRRARMQVLLDRIAIVRQIPTDVLENAHEVREYRNALIHDRGELGSLTFHTCKSRLSFFVSYLPRQW